VLWLFITVLLSQHHNWINHTINKRIFIAALGTIRPSTATTLTDLLYLSHRANTGLIFETIQDYFIFVSDLMSRVAKQLHVTYKQALPQTSASFLMCSKPKYTYQSTLCVPQAVRSQLYYPFRVVQFDANDTHEMSVTHLCLCKNPQCYFGHPLIPKLSEFSWLGVCSAARRWF